LVPLNIVHLSAGADTFAKKSGNVSEILARTSQPDFYARS
jgi:hypothetical protein